MSYKAIANSLLWVVELAILCSGVEGTQEIVHSLARLLNKLLEQAAVVDHIEGRLEITVQFLDNFIELLVIPIGVEDELFQNRLDSRSHGIQQGTHLSDLIVGIQFRNRSETEETLLPSRPRRGRGKIKLVRRSKLGHRLDRVGHSDTMLCSHTQTTRDWSSYELLYFVPNQCLYGTT